MSRTNRICLFILLVAAVLGVPGSAQRSAPRPLEIYYVDVEGGAATLIVTPARESILIDAGWASAGRDVKRIQEAMSRAGITAIDHLVLTHYHADHYGGIPDLAAAVKIGKFYDHGPVDNVAEDPQFSVRYAAYREATKNKTTELRPGAQIKLRQAAGTPNISLQCLVSNSVTLAEKKRTGKSNPECQSTELKPVDHTENVRSIVVALRYGNFDFFDPGDLTWNIERQLFCPTAPLGEIDLYQVSHHGLSTSNNPIVMRSLRPTVAIMNNGARKGGSADTVRWLREVPSLKGIYQMHLNLQTKPEDNVAPESIANLSPDADDGHMITVSVDSVASKFTVTNERTRVSQSYPIK